MTSQQSSPGSAPPEGCPAHSGRIPLYGPEFAADPASTYEVLRKYGPAAPVDLAPGVPATLVTSYNAALGILRDPGTFPKDPRRWQQNIPSDCPVLPMMMYRPNCLFSDGPTHARLRGAMSDSLNRVDPNTLRTYVEQSADKLISTLGPRGQADLLTEYAMLLPVLVLNELFGYPPTIGDRMVAGMKAIFDGVNAEEGNNELTQAALDLVALKRKHPGADVTSWLLTHPAQLTDEEMVHQIILLMGAGVEPELNLISNAMRLLLSDERFGGDLSGGSLPVEDALDEVLWTDPPMANYGTTFPVQSIDLAGTWLPEGEPVVISYAAANTDPALGSEQRAGNRAHLAWSAGPHTCPAQQHARAIASVGIEKLLDGLPDMELTVPVDQLTWRPGPFHRALASLPVRFPPVPVPVPLDDTSGENRWNDSPAPTSWTPPVATSTPKPNTSVSRAQPRWWNSLVRWWRGQ